MRIINFDEFSLCYSTERKLAGVGYTGESGLLDVAYSGESGLTGVAYTEDFTGVGYTSESRLPGAAYTGESLVRPSKPANALKGTVPEKADCER